MDATLLAHIRSLIDDTATPYKVTDVEIINLAATRRQDLYFELLTTKDDKTWYSRFNFVEVTRLTEEYEGATAITASVSDPIEGRWAFTSAKTCVYVYGFAYDLEDVVSRCWLLKSDRINVGINYSLGDESVDSSTYKQHCVDQYHRYRKSRGGQWQPNR